MSNNEGKWATGTEYTDSEIFVKKEDFPRGIYLDPKPYEESFVFNFGQEAPILEIDKHGFHFKGETIEDAGEAYKIFMEVMGMVKNDNAI